jgi:AraC-like DNA-binding protein
MYIELHLQDADLSAETIADAHHISVRQLYKIWARSAELSLSAWIIAARLEAARRDLSRPHPQAATIGAVARRWGFSDPTHFSRRFRTAFGVSPRQWSSVHAPRPARLATALPHG